MENSVLTCAKKFDDWVCPAHPDLAHGLRDPVNAAPFLEFVGLYWVPRLEWKTMDRSSNRPWCPGNPQGRGAEAGVHVVSNDHAGNRSMAVAR